MARKRNRKKTRKTRITREEVYARLQNPGQDITLPIIVADGKRMSIEEFEALPDGGVNECYFDFTGMSLPDVEKFFGITLEQVENLRDAM